MRKILKHHPFFQDIMHGSVESQWNHYILNTQNSVPTRKILIAIGFLFSLTLMVPGLSFAQTDEPNPDMWVTNASVSTIAVDNNYTYIGGNFTYVGPNTGCGTKLTTSNTFPDLTFPRVNGRVNTCVPDGIGGWYIGGNFSKVGNYTRNGIAHINSDASVDADWDPNSSGGVYSIAISESDIYVGGDFDNIGKQARNRIAKLNNIDGGADVYWNPDANGPVRSIVISGNDIYAGGDFTTIGGQPRNRIAKLSNTNGQADASWDPNANSSVYSIALGGSDIYIGGNFTSVSGQTRNYIAKLNYTDGKAEASWNPDANGRINSLAINEGDVYAGGSFTFIGGQTRNGVAKLNNVDGHVDISWDPNANNSVSSIAISGGDIYVGGSFTSISGQTMNYIARLNNNDGKAEISWNPNANGSVITMAISGSDIYLGGNFTSIGGQTMNYIARLNNSTGKVDAGWNPGANGSVSSIAISGSDIYAGGQFTSIGGQTIKYIAKLNSTDGRADASWNPNANASVITMAISGSDIYLGGNFTSIGGQTRKRIAKLNTTDGQADAYWDPNANSTVTSIAISGSDIYAGGYFISIGGQTRKYIAKLNSTDGQANVIWNPDASGRVHSIAISGNDIYVGGEFTSIGGQTRNKIAKLNSTDGKADALWDPNAGNNVNSIAISGIDIYAGGKFASIGGQTIKYIAKLNSTDGEADASWNPNATGLVSSIVISPNGTGGSDIYAGGDFYKMNDNMQPYFAVFKNELSSPSVHFTNIWAGNPYLAMNVYVTSAFLDGQDIKAGNEIGIFDGDNCVGSVVLTSAIQPGEYISIITSTDDPTTPEVDGFIEGHTITYRLWDSGRLNEVDRVTANYIQGSSTFTAQGTVRVELSGITTVTQQIEFAAGWNIFSAFVGSANSNLLQLLNPLVATSALIKAQNEEGKGIEKLTGIGWVNDIGNWSSTEGYYLKSSRDITLTLTDPPIHLPLNIPLSSGWNIISYPLQIEQDAMGVLDALITSDQLVKVQNESGDAIEKLPDPDGWVNNIGNFKPDEGYYLKTNAATTLTINGPASAPPETVLAKSTVKKKADNSLKKLTAVHFTPVYSSNPYLAMNIYIKGVSLSVGITLGANDEIGIFDGDICVGSCILAGPINSYIPMKASTDDPTTQVKDGFTQGDSIKYRFWLSSELREINDYDEKYSVGDGRFYSQGTAVVDFINVLPVELSFFIAAQNENCITLSWKTATEVNNYGFDIEKKISKGSNIKDEWNKIGFVEGHGNSSSPKEYSYVDKNLTGGSKYKYRLKQIDNDGRFEYSDVLDVEVLPNEYSLLQNYPNPFNPVTNFKFQIVKPGLVTLKIYDILGKEVGTIVNKELKAGYYSYKWDASKLATGIYFYRITAGSYTEVKKMLLIK
jgi:hypothetical protein